MIMSSALPAQQKREWGTLSARCGRRPAGMGRDNRRSVRAGGLRPNCSRHTGRSELKVAVQVRCEVPDLELLFVEWLNAIIYEMAVRNMLFGRFFSPN